MSQDSQPGISGSKKNLFIFSGLGAVMIGALLFQNCAPSYQSKNAQTSSSSSATLQSSSVPVCRFNGNIVSEGAVVTAYLASTTPTGTACISESRTCTGGKLSGTFQYGFCQVGAPAACLFNGSTVQHNQTITAYVGSTGPCQQESRVCTNGVLSGSYNYASCNGKTGDAACLFNGQTMLPGQSVFAYANSDLSGPGGCGKAEVRSCLNGSLTGSFPYASCSDKGASCLFNGQTIPSGGTILAYQTSSVNYGQTCTAEIRTCGNGVMSGVYEYSSCAAGAPRACLLDGLTVAHGETVKAYPARKSDCRTIDRLCLDGNLSGNAAFQYSSCEADPEPFSGGG